MKKRLLDILLRAKAAKEKSDVYAYLPEIIKTVEAIQDELESDSPNKLKIHQFLKGLGRLVTESYNFSESALGQDLLDLSTELHTTYNIDNN
jgi:regulator of sirC expression with transglutaminase-like and TPR domain